MLVVNWLARLGSILVCSWASLAVAGEQPNILWITSEDNGPQLGCYGDSYAQTPNIDAFAAESLRYRTAWSNAPVCAPARTTIISGMYATSLGAQHMRSGVSLPNDIKLYPQLLREAGYYCTNNSKTDYNFSGADAGWHQSNNKAHWRKRPDTETPFFAVFNFTVSHESQIRARPHSLQHDPAKAPLPKYHPDTPEVRHDWAQYYDKMTVMDRQVGEVLKQLKQDGLADSTIVFYYGDHGSGMPRSKRWPFDSGLHVPMIVHFPERFQHLAPQDYQAGGESTRLVSFVDLAPTLLSLAGRPAAANMQGVALAGEHAGPAKEYLFGFRGRMDERIDMVRSCTDGRFVYMRHFYPDRPYLKYVGYMFQTPTTRIWKEQFDAGELNEAQAKFWQPKPVEELFDLASDPDEVVNLADQPQHAERVARMRQAVKNWMIETRDLGLLPEAELHRRSGERSPREYGLSDDFSVRKLAHAAWDAIDVQSGMDLQQAIEMAQHADSGLRYWAIRGIDRRLRADPQASEAERAREVLVEALQDVSPSVAIAACDALIATDASSLNTAAAERLIELADVERVGHFAAVEALNVLDIHFSQLSPQHLAQLKQLPERASKPPHRAEGYVKRLLDYMTASDR